MGLENIIHQQELEVKMKKNKNTFTSVTCIFCLLFIVNIHTIAFVQLKHASFHIQLTTKLVTKNQAIKLSVRTYPACKYYRIMNDHLAQVNLA